MINKLHIKIISDFLKGRHHNNNKQNINSFVAYLKDLIVEDLS